MAEKKNGLNGVPAHISESVLQNVRPNGVSSTLKNTQLIYAAIEFDYGYKLPKLTGAVRAIRPLQELCQINASAAVENGPTAAAYT